MVTENLEHIPSFTERRVTWLGAPPSCWCITDGRPGMVNQTIGLAEAMGLTPIVKTVFLKTPWRIATPHLMAWKRYALSNRGDALSPPWPDIVIATGRPAILPSLYVKGQGGGRTFTIQIQDPVSLRRRFDRIIVPAHDGVRGENIVVVDGALHRLTSKKLQDEAHLWRARFASIPEPRVAVLIGGNNSRYRLGEAEMALLSDQLLSLARSGHGLLITPSRRTDENAMSVLRQRLAGAAAYIWNGQGENPYFAMLGSANAVIVTCDSVNMITEACSTGKPVHLVRLPSSGRRGGGERDKFALFHRKLEADNRIRIFDGTLHTWNYEPLCEMERVSQKMIAAYQERI